jgi:UDP-N-acetyl-D-galactosamine dehydrogenase
VIENSQRDINIAFMNELSVIFHKMGIDTKEVLEAAGTKWNFLKFLPGLVGGHCIGVDPYYLTHKAAQLGYHSQVILSGRRINDDMGKYVAENIVKGLIKMDKTIRGSKVAILGFTFKENCQDTRNTKVIDIINELHDYGIQTVVVDDVADRDEAKRLYGLDIVEFQDMEKVDVIAVCVQHDIYKSLTRQQFDQMYRDSSKIIFDLKGMYNKTEFTRAGYFYWRL